MTSVTVTGTKVDANASVSSPVTLNNLEVGVAHTVTITATAQNGVTKAYTVYANFTGNEVEIMI